MAAAAFDTITEVQRLRDAGIPQEQAEAITLLVRNGVTGGVANKADLERVEERLGGEIKLVRKDVEALDDKIDTKIDGVDQKIDLVKEALETKIESASRNTIIWLGCAIIAAAVITGVAARYFPPPG